MLPLLKKEDLKIGMKVQLQQLDCIYDLYMLMSDTHMALDDNGLPSIVEGTLVYKGTKFNTEYTNTKNKYPNCMLVINSKESDEYFDC